MTPLSAPWVRLVAALRLGSDNRALSAGLSPGRERCGRFQRLYMGRGWLANMRGQNLETPEIAQFVRGASAGYWWGWERLANQYSVHAWAWASTAGRGCS